MRLLIDTNVVLDVMLKREPFYKSGAEILKLADRVSIQLFVSASSVTDIYYISRKCLGSRLKAKEALEKLFSVVSVAGVTEDEIKQAMLMDWKDFEDSVQYAVAVLQGIDGIVTRDGDDYGQSDIRIWLPEELLEEVK